MITNVPKRIDNSFVFFFSFFSGLDRAEAEGTNNGRIPTLRLPKEKNTARVQRILR